MPYILEGFGCLLETCRAKKGYSREKLGEVVGVTSKHIYNIEHGNGSLSLDLLKKLVCALDIPTVPVFYPTTDHVDSQVDEISRELRLMDEKELSIVKDLLDSLLRNRKNVTDNLG